MVRLVFIGPKIETSKTYSFFTGINVYTGLGCYGLVVAFFGFGIVVEYLKCKN